MVDPLAGPAQGVPPESVPTFADSPPGEDLDLDEVNLEFERELEQPGSPKSFLSAEDEEILADDIEVMLAAYESTMKDRWDREKLIEECYHLVPQKEWSGEYEEAAELVSETIMAGVDQAVARMVGQFLSVRPLVAVNGIESAIPQADSTKVAEQIENYMDRFLRHRIQIERTLPIHLYPAVRTGTAIIRAYWDEAKQTVPWTPIQSRDAVLWPPWRNDWQEAEWAGHKTVLTLSQFKNFAHSLELDPAFVEELCDEGGESKPEEATATFDTLASEKIKPEGMTSTEKQGLIGVYELWGNVALPGKPLTSKFRLYFHREKKKILWAELNKTRTKRHPYCPLRYKITGASAWGMGLGQELLPFQAQDSIYMNLETDTLRASCFGVYLVSRGSIANAMFETPVPGQIIPTEDPSGDFRHESLANSEPLQMLQIARNTNEQRKMNASGLAAVLQGQGDPTMKSGAGTGSTMALIEQASKKFGQIDRNVRNDFADLCLHTLELAVQFSQAACFSEYLAPEDADFLSQFVTAGPMADKPYSEFVRISLQAPSASNNDDMRRERLLVVYNMIQQHASLMIQQFGTPILQQTNPAAVVAYMKAWADLLALFGEKVIESHEVPGAKGKIPQLDQFIQPDVMTAQMNQLMQQIQQQEQQLQMMEQALQNPPEPGNGGQDGVGGATRRQSGSGGVS